MEERGSEISLNANISANAGNYNVDENAGKNTPQNTKADDLEKQKDLSREEDLLAGKVDDLQSNSQGAAETERAGTAERKQYGDTELNKGLESQVQDLEGA